MKSFHPRTTKFALGTALCAALLTSLVHAQASTPLPCTMKMYGNSCGAVLSGSSSVSGNATLIDLGLRGAFPNAPYALVIGVQPTNVPLPGGCPLLAGPLLTLTLQANSAGTGTPQLLLPGAFEGELLFQAIPYDPNTGSVRSSNGVKAKCNGLLVVQSVTPGSGKEGDTIVIRGSGFDPNPASHCILLPGGAIATVLTATPTQLVARIGAVPTTASGTIMVAGGRRVALPTGAMRLGGIKTVVSNANQLDVDWDLNTGLPFRVGTASPNTSLVVAQGNSFLIQIPVPTKPATQVIGHLALWGQFKCFEVNASISIPTGLTAAEGGGALAEYIRLHVPDLDVISVSGANVLVQPAARVGKLLTASGSIKVE